MKDKNNKEPNDYISSVSNSINGNELTPLEAWQIIKSHYYLLHYPLISKEVDIVETALKKQEQDKNRYYSIDNIREDIIVIIKKKGVG